MNEFALQRLGMLMEPEPGNPQEVEGVLNPAAAAVLMASFTFSPAWWQRATIRASALPACNSTVPVIQSGRAPRHRTGAGG